MEDRQILRELTEHLITQIQREMDYHREGIIRIDMQIPMRGGRLRDHVVQSCKTETKSKIKRRDHE